jgi:hypothetical protein
MSRRWTRAWVMVAVVGTPQGMAAAATAANPVPMVGASVGRVMNSPAADGSAPELDPRDGGDGCRRKPPLERSVSRRQTARPAGTVPSPWQRYTEINLHGDPKNHGHLLITDDTGHRTGYHGGHYINEIPGADFYPSIAAGDPEPTYRIPDATHVTLTIDGRELKKACDDTTLYVFGRGHTLVFDNVQLRHGERQTVDFAVDGSWTTYATRGYQTPKIKVIANYAHAYYTFIIHGRYDGDRMITVRLPLDKATFSLASSARAGRFIIETTRLGTDGSRRIHRRPPFTLGAGDTATFDYGAWDHGGQMGELQINHAPPRTGRESPGAGTLPTVLSPPDRMSKRHPATSTSAPKDLATTRRNAAAKRPWGVSIPTGVGPSAVPH